MQDEQGEGLVFTEHQNPQLPLNSGTRVFLSIASFSLVSHLAAHRAHWAKRLNRRRNNCKRNK